MREIQRQRGVTVLSPEPHMIQITETMVSVQMFSIFPLPRLTYIDGALFLHRTGEFEITCTRPILSTFKAVPPLGISWPSPSIYP